MKRALITGITGMDGSYLAEFLLEKDYKVFGMERRTSTKNRVNTSHLENKITFLMGDLSDQSSLLRVLKESNPDEVYNLASQSFVKESWNSPEQSADITGVGVLRMLEAIRMNGKSVKLPINDRGPYIDGRILDCSYGAALRLDFVKEGTTEVKVKVIKWGDNVYKK